MPNELYEKIYTAAPPTMDTVLKNDKVATGLGWLAIILGLVLVICIFVAIYKLFPIALAFMSKNSHKAEEAKDASTNYIIGFVMLLVGPVIIMAICGYMFGDVIINAVKTAITGLFK